LKDRNGKNSSFIENMEDKAGFVVGLDYKYSLWGLDDQSEEYQVGFYSRNLLLMFHVLTSRIRSQLFTVGQPSEFLTYVWQMEVCTSSLVRG